MIQTRDELIEFALRRLGHPVIEVNVTKDQCDDCVDEVLQRYYEFHSDGSQRIYLTRIVTAEDALSQTVKMPNDVIAVTRAINSGSGSMTHFGNLTNQMYITDLIQKTTRAGIGGFGRFYTEYSRGSTTALGSYQSNMGYLATMGQLFNADKPLRFVKHGHHVRFDTHDKIKENDLIAFECYAMNTAEEYPDTYNDLWVKRYTVAMIKKQWANNLIKYNGFTLPSGLTIDGSTILQEANSDLEKLEQELRDTWEEPILPMIG